MMRSEQGVTEGTVRWDAIMWPHRPARPVGLIPCGGCWEKYEAASWLKVGLYTSRMREAVSMFGSALLRFCKIIRPKPWSRFADTTLQAHLCICLATIQSHLTPAGRDVHSL